MDMVSLGPLELMVILVVWGLPVWACLKVAGEKGRSRWVWGTLAVLLPVVTLVVLALLPTQRPRPVVH